MADSSKLRASRTPPCRNVSSAGSSDYKSLKVIGRRRLLPNTAALVASQAQCNIPHPALASNRFPSIGPPQRSHVAGRLAAKECTTNTPLSGLARHQLQQKSSQLFAAESNLTLVMRDG